MLDVERKRETAKNNVERKRDLKEGHTSNGMIMLMHDKMPSVRMLVPLIQVIELVYGLQGLLPSSTWSDRLRKVLGEESKVIIYTCFTCLDSCELRRG